MPPSSHQSPEALPVDSGSTLAGLGGLDLEVGLFDQMQESVAIYRCDATCLYVNPATERLFGKKRDEMVGRVLWEVFPELVGDDFHQVFGRVVETGQQEEFESYCTPWGRWFVNRLFRSRGRIYVLARESSERLDAKRAEDYAHTALLYEETRRAEQRAAFLAQASEVLASSLDHDQILQRLTQLAIPTLADWCAVDVPTADGHVRRVSMAHEWPERVAQAHAFLAKYPISLGDPEGIGKVLRTGTLEFIPEIPAELVEQSIPDAEKRRAIRELGLKTYICVPLISRGRPLGALTLAYAESDRRYTPADLRLAEDLARRAATSLDNGLLYKAAQDAIQARDAFLSVASHELNTPLTSLHLNVQALQRSLKAQPSGGLPPPEAIQAKLQAVQRQTLRLSNLVRELLDMSRITAGKLKLDREEVDLAALAHEIATRFGDDLSRAGCELRLEVPLPVVGYWDRLRVEQVLQNLLSNAIKYGQGHPIEVQVAGDEHRAWMTVRDHGIGIPAESRERVFQRFERLASERNYGGFGLGLWIVKQIVDAMEGTIHVESDLGQGSVFTVELPRHSNRMTLQ